MLKLTDLAVRVDFSIGPLRVSPALRIITGPAGEVHVEPLIMQVLILLVEAKGQVVTRNHLFDECWGGANIGDFSLNRTITMVRRIAAETGPGTFRIESIPRTGYRLVTDGEPAGDGAAAGSGWRSPLALGGVLALVLALTALAWMFLDRPPREPSIAVTPAGDSRSAALADSLEDAAMITAAEYQTPVRLLAAADSRGQPTDFVLRVQRIAGNAPGVKLTLVSGREKSSLWRWSLEGDAAAVEEKARIAGALALTCAAETRAGGNPSPDLETVKRYLDACARFEPWEGAQLALLPDAFEKVTERAPQLHGAWAKLFLSKAEAIEGFPPIDLVDSLKKDIRNSYAHGVELPETYIAEAAVLPLNARFERLGLYEAGLARYPRSPFLLGFRSWQLRSVGRMNQAARTAGGMAALYPQSSAAIGEYAKSLMHSGRIDAARNVLEKARRSAPDAANLDSPRWILEMRYGDPKLALNIARSGRSVVGMATISFLEARVDPTPANIDRAIAELAAEYRADPREPGLLAQAQATFGRTEDAIQLLLRYDGRNSGDGVEMLFRPHMRAVRRDPRFMRIARNFGVTDYWIKSGILPDFCFEPGLPYDCKTELAKLAS